MKVIFYYQIITIRSFLPDFHRSWFIRLKTGVFSLNKAKKFLLKKNHNRPGNMESLQTGYGEKPYKETEMTQAIQNIQGTQVSDSARNMFKKSQRAVFSSPSIAAAVCPQNLILMLSGMGREAQWIGWDSRRQYIALI